MKRSLLSCCLLALALLTAHPAPAADVANTPVSYTHLTLPTKRIV